MAKTYPRGTHKTRQPRVRVTIYMSASCHAKLTALQALNEGTASTVISSAIARLYHAEQCARRIRPATDSGGDPVWQAK